MRPFFVPSCLCVYEPTSIFRNRLLEHVLQRHLHNPLLTGGEAQGSSTNYRQALAEGLAGYGCLRIRGIKVVRQVERFGSELQRLFLTHSEFPCQAHVDTDASRTENIPASHAAVFTWSRPYESRRVEPLTGCFVRSVRRGKHLMWSSVGCA